MTTIYIPCASRDLERAKRVRQWCRDIGLTISHDWITALESEAGTPESELPRTVRLRHATDDLLGALAADIVWFLVPDKGTHTAGAWIEFGAAIGQLLLRALEHPSQRPQLVICSRSEVGCDSIFLELGADIITRSTTTQADAVVLQRLVEEFVPKSATTR